MLFERYAAAHDIQQASGTLHFVISHPFLAETLKVIVVEVFLE